MRPIILALSLAALTASSPPASALPTTPQTHPPVMAWSALVSRPRLTPTRTIPYGTDPLEVADLWLPSPSRAARPNKAPFPTIIMVHGGCWTSAIADRSYMNWAAADLARRGYAVWNIEYRGVDKPGGGYPGTLRDVAAAADALRSKASTYNLDLSRLVVVGHSAGGHLGLWLAARPRLPAGSPLYAANPTRIHHVVSLGGLPDLEQDRAEANGCGAQVIDKLVGPPSMNSRDVYADTSPTRLAPLHVAQTTINGDRDEIIPTRFAATYAARMRARGDRVTVRIVPGAGHVELIAPETRAWAAAVEAIKRATR